MEDQEVTLVMQLVASQRKFEKQMRAMSRAAHNNFNKMTKYGRNFERSMGRVANNVKTIFAGAFAGFASANLISGLFDVNKKFQDFETSLRVATGSIAKAKGAFADIRKFATETPYGVAEITNGFIKLINRGLRPSMSVMKSFGNTASAMGKSLDQMIEAVADAAFGEFERLKEFGINAKTQGEKITFTFQGVTKTVKKNAREITAYLKSIGDIQFAGLMADRMKNLSGLASNLGDKIDNLYLIIGNAGATGLFASAIRLAGDAVDFFAGNMNVLEGIFAGVAVVIVGALIPAIKAMTIALWANPFGLVIVAISSVVGLLVSLSDTMIGTGKNAASLGAYFGVAWDYIVDKTKAVLGWFSELGDGQWPVDAAAALSKYARVHSYIFALIGTGLMTLPTIGIQAASLIAQGFVLMAGKVGAVFRGLFEGLKQKFIGFGESVLSFLSDPLGGFHMKSSLGIADAIDAELDALPDLQVKTEQAAKKISSAFKHNSKVFNKLFDFSDVGDAWTEAAKARDDANKPIKPIIPDDGYLPEFVPPTTDGTGSGAGGGKGGKGSGAANDNAYLDTIAKFGSYSDKSRVAADKFAKSMAELRGQSAKGKIDQETYNNAVESVKGVYEQAKAAAADYGAVVGTIMDGVKGTLKSVFSQIFKDGKITMTSLADMVNDMMGRIFDKLSGLAIDGIFSAMGFSGGGAVGKFADGGMVQHLAAGGGVFGAGTGRSDSIPAMLSNGEFVVNANATGRHRALLEQINSGNKIAFANQNSQNQNVNINAQPIVNFNISITNAPPNMRVTEHEQGVDIDFIEAIENGLSERARNGDSNLLHNLVSNG